LILIAESSILCETVPGSPSKSWAEVAAENDRIVHPGMQIHRISRPAGTPSEHYDLNEYLNELEWGSLPLPERSIIVDVLGTQTETPDQCWFCVWEGFGSLDCTASARVELPQRNYALFSGPINLALVSLDLPPAGAIMDPPDLAWNDQSPNIWWPDDRAWVVATEINHAWTYVGGTAELVDQLLVTDGLEVLRVELSDQFRYGSDTINAKLDLP
jgi:hypothetical protein